MSDCWLVTGAQGFVGRHLLSAIAKASPLIQVVGVGRSPYLPNSFSHSITGPAGRIPAPLSEGVAGSSPAHSYRQINIVDEGRISDLLRELRPATIIHVASALRDDPRLSLFETNVEGTARLFESVSLIPHYSPLIVLGSSGGVYGRIPASQLPIAETACCNPVDEYTISKRSSELLSLLMAKRFQLRLRVARVFNVLGSGQDERHIGGQLALDLMRIKKGKQKDLVLGPLTSTRDFIDVRDVASALLLLAKLDTPNGTYNVASGLETSVEDVLEAFIEASGVSVTPKLDNTRVSEISRQVADVSRLRSLGFRAENSLKTSALAIWKYYECIWAGSG